MTNTDHMKIYRLFTLLALAVLVSCSDKEPVPPVVEDPEEDVEDVTPEEPEEPVNPADTLQKYADDEIKIMSFNVRLATTETNPANEWPNRKEACLEMIMDHFPTLIGLQEAKFSNQWLYFKSSLKEFYGAFGVNRDTGYESGTGETMGILYNLNQVELITSGTFWLSETPDKLSKSWESACYRTATWGLFKHKKTGKEFCYINTHLDHKSKDAQINGAKVIVEKFALYNPDGNLQILTGDFNVTPGGAALDVFEDDMVNTRVVARKTDSHTTFNGWTTDKHSIIDHIFVTKGTQVSEYHTVSEQYGSCQFISDHYPIVSLIKIK